MATRALKDIKEGDRVWIDEIGTGNGRDRTIRTVVKLTPTQVVVDWPYGDKVKRFQRGKAPSYPHLNPSPTYFQIGYSGWHTPEIQRIASRSECEQWDAEQETKRQQALVEIEARKQKEALRDELRGLFGNRMASVGEGYHQPDTEWRVELYLTESGVRRLAQLIDQLTPEELPSWERD